MKEKAVAFISGYVPAFISGLAIPGGLVDAVAKIVVAALVGFVGGYCGLLGKHFFEQQKNKKNGRN